MRYKSISVFLPAYNEEENIKTCIFSIEKYLSKRVKEYEILVITDGSTDNTVKIVKECAKKNKRIKLIHRKKRLGYGAALRAGFSNSSKDLIFYTDADNQYNIEDLDKLFPLLDSYDIVSGYRIDRQDPLMRIFVAWVYNMLIRILFKLDVQDIDASFKLYKKDVFEKMKVKANTGLIDAEVLIKVKKSGFSIGQIGVRHYPRLMGRTVYAVGGRNKFLTIVRPQVIIDVLNEMRNLWSDLR